MPTTSSPTSNARSPLARSTPGLIGWLVVAAVLVSAAFAATSGGGEVDDPIYRWDVAIGGSFVYLVLIGLTFGIGAMFGDSVRAVGIVPFARRWLWIALGVVVVSVIVSAALEPLLHAGERQGLAPDEWRADRLWPFVANTVLIVALGPFAEELFFRGAGVTALGTFGPVAAVVGTAAIFGLSHGLLVALPALVFFGAGLGWVRLRSESVWPGFIAHAAYNGIGIAITLALL